MAFGIRILNRYLLKTYYVPTTVVGCKDKTVNKMKFSHLMSLHSSGEDTNKQIYNITDSETYNKKGNAILDRKVRAGLTEIFFFFFIAKLKVRERAIQICKRCWEGGERERNAKAPN